MKHYPAPKTPDSVIHEIHEMARAGASHEEMIARMRELGLWIPPSIKLLSEVTGMAGNEAKYAVHFSRTWQDMLMTNEAVHDAAIEAARMLGATVTERELPAPVELVSK